jgi:hypothetical protein
VNVIDFDAASLPLIALMRSIAFGSTTGLYGEPAAFFAGALAAGLGG